MKASDLLKDKNKLLMGIPIILGMLFIYVFFIHAGQSEETQQKEDASAFFEPTAQESEKAGDKLEAYKDANYLKGGIVYADRITTVSNTYAEEIKMPFYGEKLDGLMNARSNCLSGIVNGIDYDDYNPETDKHIARNYSVDNFRKERSK